MKLTQETHALTIRSFRGGLLENAHHFWAIAVSINTSAGASKPEHLLYSTPGSAELKTFFRSSAKPFQAFPIVRAGLADQLSQQQLAIACASHSGAAMHLRWADSILQMLKSPSNQDLVETSLGCGPQLPVDETEQQALRQQHLQPTRLHNNCSGKHAAMLWYLAQQGIPIAGYLSSHHPLQQEILGILQAYGEVSDIPVAVDGCGLPTFYLPLKTMALLYAKLGVLPEFQPITQAMTTYPELVGGDTGRVDTAIMQATAGKLLAKVGADGLLCVSKIAAGEGLALKLLDGNGPVRDLTVVHLLRHLGWLSQEQLDHPALQPWQRLSRFNTNGDVVGMYQLPWQDTAQ